MTELTQARLSEEEKPEPLTSQTVSFLIVKPTFLGWWKGVPGDVLDGVREVIDSVKSVVCLVTHL